MPNAGVCAQRFEHVDVASRGAVGQRTAFAERCGRCLGRSSGIVTVPQCEFRKPSGLCTLSTAPLAPRLGEVAVSPFRPLVREGRRYRESLGGGSVR